MIAISNLVGSSARLIAVSHVRQERFTKVLLPKHYDVCTLGSRRFASGFRPRGCRVPDGVSHLKCEQRRSTNSRDSAGAVFRGEVGADNATFGRTLPSTADQAKVSPPRIAAPSATARRIERVLWSGRRKSSMSVPRLVRGFFLDSPFAAPELSSRNVLVEFAYLTPQRKKK